MVKKLAFAAIMCFAYSASGNAAELVRNGSFEVTTATKKERFENRVTDWSGGSALTFIATPGSADNGEYLSVYGPFPRTSPVGGNFVLADGDPNYSSAISQTIGGLTVGETYALSFYQAAGQQLGFTGPTTERWRVTFGGQTQLSSLFTLPQGGVGDWQKQTMTFTASATSQVLSFLAQGTPNGAPPISMLDGVSLTAVPETATWAMMLMGFGLVGAGARARTRSRAAVA